MEDEQINEMLKEIHRICKRNDIESGIPLYDDGQMALLRECVKRHLPRKGGGYIPKVPLGEPLPPPDE